VSMKPFLRTMLTNSISGMISALRGCSEPDTIIIKIETGAGRAARPAPAGKF